jgi:hypothetical protein
VSSPCHIVRFGPLHEAFCRGLGPHLKVRRALMSSPCHIVRFGLLLEALCRGLGPHLKVRSVLVSSPCHIVRFGLLLEAFCRGLGHLKVRSALVHVDVQPLPHYLL